MNGLHRPQITVSAALSISPPVFIGPLGLQAPPAITIECEAFQGSLITLVQCVASRKVELSDVPLHPICLAYIDYLLEVESLDLDGAASALIALAYLYERKAESLLPKPEKVVEEEEFDYDDTPFESLGPAMLALQACNEERDQLYFRSPEDDPAIYDLPVEISNVSVEDLGRALEKLLAKAVPESVQVLGKPRRSLADQMKIVLRCLKETPSPLDELVEGEFSRLEAVWWFLALLELIRLGEAMVELSEEGETLFWRRP